VTIKYGIIAIVLGVLENQKKKEKEKCKRKERERDQ